MEEVFKVYYPLGIDHLDLILTLPYTKIALKQEGILFKTSLH